MFQDSFNIQQYFVHTRCCCVSGITFKLRRNLKLSEHIFVLSVIRPCELSTYSFMCSSFAYMLDVLIMLPKPLHIQPSSAPSLAPAHKFCVIFVHFQEITIDWSHGFANTLQTAGSVGGTTHTHKYNSQRERERRQRRERETG